MSVIGSNILAGASGQAGYNLTKSLRFRRSASAYLNRTFGTPTNNKLFTWSGWVKRSEIGVWNDLFGAGGSNGFGFNTAWNDNGLAFFTNNISGDYFYLVTTQVFRDPSAWYHIVLSVDTTQATPSNRAKIYVNGVQITAFNSAVYQSQNSSLTYNSATAHYLGSLDGTIRYFDGYLAEVNFIDGQALTPSSFGSTNSATGVWQPKKYTGTYGTNGFYLPFTDTTSTSTLGTDFSGNSNTWTVNNISLTSGSTYDSMTDVPTLTSATTANYCTLNAALQAGGYTLNDGNLNWARTGGTGGTNDRSQFGTIGVTSGKWYWEFTAGTVNSNSIPGFGIAIGSASTQSWGGSQTGVYIYESDGLKYLSGTGSSYGATFTTGDIIGVAFDADAGTLTFYKNNTSQGQAASGLTSGPYFPAVTRTVGGGGSNGTEIANFGQRPFAYTPPTGFVALNTFNLPTPTIGATASSQANKYFDATTFDGVTGGGTVTNSGSMQPDFVWMKVRNNANNHELADSVRGTPYASFSNLTNAEVSDTRVSAFNSNGFSYGTNSNSAITGRTVVGWQWRASNATAVTNTAGSITSTVSANTTAGFSIVTYTGTGANATVGHGLGVAPSIIIVKGRFASNWSMYNASLTNATTSILILNSTSAVTGSLPTYWNSTAPTSTVFSLGSDSNINSTNAAGLVAYCFAQVAGYSAFGSYTGNGSTDGPFIFTGFRPRYLMIKRTDTTNNWVIQDTSRDTYNVSEKDLYADTSGAEATYVAEKTDILSNGFKQRQTGASMNASGGTYIYMAFCESPFKFSNAR